MNALYAILALFLALSHVEGHDDSAHIRERRQLQLPPIIPARGQNDLFGVRPLNAGSRAGYNGPGPINFGNYRGGPQPINVGPGSNYANVQEPAQPAPPSGGRQPGMYPGGVDFTAYGWGRRR